MREKTIELHGVDEVVGYGSSPAFERRSLRLPVEGIVEFDGVESLGVVLEPA